MTSSINHSMNSKVWAMLILLSILWGGSFFFVGVVVNDLPPLTIVTLRVGIAAFTLWGIAMMLGLRPPKSLKVWGAFLGMGLLNNVIPFALIVWGQTQIASGLASILNAATPIFTVVVAGILLPDERPTPLKLFGVVLGFVGVVVMIGVPALGGVGSLFAQLAIVAATVSYAFAGVYGRRFKSLGINPVVTAAGQVTASTLLLLPITLFVDGTIDTERTNMSTWIAITGLAVASTAIAYVLYFKILELAGATNVLLVTLLVPVSATLLGSLFLNESLEVIHILGMGLIAFGLSAIDGRLWHRLKSAFA
ncbi:EamA/RhaT family transporter [Grimontia hollisae]|uniref:Permease n=2 Tax=Grimontia hollisae TaxID=673 RepID=D0I8Z4_GRIHO|nr:DMT family transporter [Grimontia hollisae]AMG28882.1 EamA/RhaT family transporter [Grimontia hollisae]EEY71909.1 permease [Grimontia hollisae CIP 101886]MDF2184682.1 DMT family transporter [Grimontia hollisae]STO77342.1 Probable amino-acid metabolite efflux pump [Grimontia hollisae]STO98421.1 Probable amino-acid metabolite efflux pump [Grimontia hollisae]